MEAFLERFAVHLEVERNLSSYTVRNYSMDVLGFLEFLRREGVASLEGVLPSHIRQYLGELLSSGIVRASVARKLSALRSFFRFLNNEGLIHSDPLSKVSGPKREKRLPEFLTASEIRTLIESPDTSTPYGMRDRALLELLYASGLRVSEIVSLDVKQVDISVRQIRVRGKGSKERMVLMGEPAARALEAYLKFGRPKLLGKRKTEALFLNRYGRRIAERRVQYLLKAYAKQIGLGDRLHPHMVRHTFATHMLDGGADLRVVQELLGHASLSSTQVYTHVTKGQMRRRYLEAHPRSRRSAGEDEAGCR